MFPVNSAEREWCFIGENSKEGITSFYVVGEEVMKKEIIKERAGA